MWAFVCVSALMLQGCPGVNCLSDDDCSRGMGCYLEQCYDKCNSDRDCPLSVACDQSANLCLYPGDMGGLDPDAGVSMDADGAVDGGAADADLSDAGLDADLSDGGLDADLSDAGLDMDAADMSLEDAALTDMEMGDMDLPDMEVGDMELPDMELPDMEMADMDMSDAGVPPDGTPDFSGQYAVTRTVILSNVDGVEEGTVENTSVSISPDPQPPQYRIVTRDVQGQRLSEASAVIFEATAVDDLAREFSLELDYTVPMASPPLLCFGSTIHSLRGSYLFDAGEGFEMEGTENETLDFSGDSCPEPDGLTIWEVRWNRLD